MTNKVSGAYKYFLSSFYYGGVFALCMSGLQAVAGLIKRVKLYTFWWNPLSLAGQVLEASASDIRASSGCHLNVIVTTDSSRKANDDIEESLKFMGILMGELIVLGLSTYISEGIIRGFADIQSAIYDVPWYDFSKTSGKRLHLMTTMSAFPGFRTLNGYELTFEHFGDVLNAAYKYYNLLITVK